MFFFLPKTAIYKDAHITYMNTTVWEGLVSFFFNFFYVFESKLFIWSKIHNMLKYYYN